MTLLGEYMNMEFLGEHKAPILTAVCLGVISLAALKKFLNNSQQTKKYPIEIDFSQKQVQEKLGRNLNDFLAKLNKNPEEALVHLQELYPNECTLRLDSYPVVFLNSIESFKKFNQKVSSTIEPIANRPQNPIFQLVSKNYLGSFFRLYDDKAKEIRKSSIAGLHKLTANMNEFEAKLAEEVQEFLEFLSSKAELKSAPVHVQQISTNMIVAVGINARFPYELGLKTAVKDQINNISEILSALDIVTISNMTDASGFKPLESKLNSIYDFLTNALDGYKASYEKDVIRTFGDYVLSKQAELADLKPEDVYSDRDILVQFFTLLMAGAVTTGFTLSWAFYYLAKNPNVQTKMYEEIGNIVGTGAFIGTKHRSQLKYTEAVINEILRLSSTQPIIGRATVLNPNNRDLVNVDSYTLPSNTPVFVNAYAIHRDPNYWPDGERFDPMRWFNDRGDLLPHLNSFVPFGAGPRSCIGDSLSRLILFLVVANVVQRFELAVQGADSSSKVGVMRRPPSYDLRLSVRK